MVTGTVGGGIGIAEEEQGPVTVQTIRLKTETPTWEANHVLYLVKQWSEAGEEF